MAPQILLVDDDHGFLHMMQTLLADEGYCFLTAQNGADAYELYRQRSPHLIVSDTNMPVMSGITLLDLVRKHSQRVPFLLLFSYSMEDPSLTEEDLIMRGATSVMSKSQAGRELEGTVRNLLRDVL